MSKTENTDKLKSKLWNKLRKLDQQISFLPKWLIQGKWVYLNSASEKKFKDLDEKRKTVRVALKTLAAPVIVNVHPKIHH